MKKTLPLILVASINTMSMKSSLTVQPEGWGRLGKAGEAGGGWGRLGKAGGGWGRLGEAGEGWGRLGKAGEEATYKYDEHTEGHVSPKAVQVTPAIGRPGVGGELAHCSLQLTPAMREGHV